MPQQYATDAYLLSLFPQFQTLQRAQWRVTVLSALVGTEYSIEASTDPTPYAATAQNGDTPTSLRNKLRAAVNGTSTVITAASSLMTKLLVTEVVAGTVELAVGPELGLDVELVTPTDKYAALRATWLAAKQPSIGLCAWGENAALGHALLTAHFIIVALGLDPNTGISAGDITAMSLGPASVTLGSGKAAASSNPLAATAVGRLYLQMHGELVLGPITDLGGGGCFGGC